MTAVPATKAKKKIQRPLSEKIFDGVNLAILLIFSALIVIPFMNLLSISVSDELAIMSNRVTIFPVGFSLNSYKTVLTDDAIIRAYGNTLFVAVTGTVSALLVTSFAAYPLAYGKFRGKKLYNAFIMLTMWFGAGMIPRFVIMSKLGLINSHLALIMAHLASAYNILILTNYFRSVPASLIESAKIDGANDFYILFRIAMPLAKPGLATIALWVFIAHWNDYMAPLVYIRDMNKYTLQIMLREIVLASTNTQILEFEGGTAALPEQLKHAVIVVAMIPVMVVYPFIQRYFVKGIMLGSVKE